MGKKGGHLIGERQMFLRKNYDGLESFVWEGTGRTIGTLFPAQLSPCDPPTIEPTPKWDEQSALVKEFGGGGKEGPPWGLGKPVSKNYGANILVWELGYGHCLKHLGNIWNLTVRRIDLQKEAILGWASLRVIQCNSWRGCCGGVGGGLASASGPLQLKQGGGRDGLELGDFFPRPNNFILMPRSFLHTKTEQKLIKSRDVTACLETYCIQKNDISYLERFFLPEIVF